MPLVVFWDTATAPLSYAPADLVSVDFQTAYEALPVGGNGTDYRPTALRVVFRTSGSPSDIAPGTEVVYQAAARPWGFGIGLGLKGTVSKTPTGTMSATASIARTDVRCDDEASLCWERSNPAWTAQIDVAQKTLTLTYPFSTFGPEENSLIGVGSDLYGLSAYTLPQQEVPDDSPVGSVPLRIDTATRGHLHVVGEDVPPDVGCTQECESTPLPCTASVGISDNNFDAITFRASVDGACKSPDKVNGVRLTITSQKCTAETPCTEEVIVDDCPGRKCGRILRVPYLYPETAEYRIRADWEYSDGDGFGFGWIMCHHGLGLEECPDSSRRLVHF